MRTKLRFFALQSMLTFAQMSHPPISLIVGPASAHSMTTAPAKRRLLHAISCLSSTPPDPHCSLCSVANSPQRVILQRKLSRSEEHTSELQSLMRISYAVFCLKKKKNNK